MSGTVISQDRPSRRHLLLLIASAAVGSGSLVGLSACTTPAAPPAAPTVAPPPATTKTDQPAAPKAAATPAPKPEPTVPPKPAPTAAPKPLEQTTIRIVTPAGIYDNVYSRIGVEKGIYRKYGLTNVEFSENPSGTRQVNAVLAGEVDWAEAGLPAPMAAIEQGAALKVFGAPLPRVTFILIGKPEISQPTDLYGKSIGTGDVGSQLHTMALAYLNRYNLDPTKVDFVNAGASAGSVDVAKAVVAGKVDAGVVTSDFQFELPKYPGVKLISDLARDVPDFLRLVLFAKADLLDSKPEFMTAASLAFSESLRYALDHRDETIALAMKMMSKDKGDIEQFFDYFQKERRVNPDLDFSPAQIAYMQDLFVKIGLQKNVVPFEKVADQRYMQAVIAKLGKYVPKS